MPYPSRDAPQEPSRFQNQDEILLGLLSAVDRDSKISQRTISRELGVALGLANAYLKRCVSKGWIKIHEVPRRRFIYYLTPQGFAEKTRLAGQYFSASFTFFRRARQQMSDLMAECAANGWHRIVFVGVSELAEVGTLCAYDHPIKLVAIIDPVHIGEKFCGLSVKTTLSQCEPYDAVIVTSLSTPEKVFEAVKAEIGSDRVLAPRLLRLALPQSDKSRPSIEAAE